MPLLDLPPDARRCPAARGRAPLLARGRAAQSAGSSTRGTCRRSWAATFVAVYGALRALEESGELGGRWFCEWGSGLGVVACLASMLGFDAWGIEAEADLVRAARRLAWDFDVEVEFVARQLLPLRRGKQA